MDSATTLPIIEKFVSGGFGITPNEIIPWVVGSMAAMVVVVFGLFLYAIRRYERYRDRQDAKRERQWEQEAQAKVNGREWHDQQSQARFDKLEQHTEKFFDEMEIAAKEDRKRLEEFRHELSGMKWELESIKKAKGG